MRFQATLKLFQFNNDCDKVIASMFDMKKLLHILTSFSSFFTSLIQIQIRNLGAQTMQTSLAKSEKWNESKEVHFVENNSLIRTKLHPCRAAGPRPVLYKSKLRRYEWSNFKFRALLPQPYLITFLSSV